MQNVSRTIFSFILFMMGSTVWAFPVPDTGQNKCYNNTSVITCPSPGQPFYGQDASYAINRMSYTKLDDKGGEIPDSADSWSMVKDNVTGLIWEIKTNKDVVENYSDPHDADNTYIYKFKSSGNGPYTDGFLKLLNDAGYGGFSDWRLPDLHELNTIIDCGIPAPGPTIVSRYFPNTVSSNYWSTTVIPYLCTFNRDVFSNRVVNFENGDFGQSMMDYAKISVRAVRGDKLNNVTNFDAVKSAGSNNVGGSVKDNSTGLMWQSDPSSDKMNWEQALSYCEKLDLDGYTDWRLPTIKEFRSLVNYENCSMDQSYFSSYWTSTPDSNNAGFARCARYSHGIDETCNMNDMIYVRAVRGGLGKCKTTIEANETKNQISVASDTVITVTVSLEPGDKTNKTADWWFALDSPWGWYFLTSSEITQMPVPYYQSIPLYGFFDQKIIEGRLPTGNYTFYFGIYITPNDSVDSPLFIDSVKVYVVE